MDRHKEAVNKLSTAVRSFYDRGLPYRVYHGSTNSTRTQNLDPASIIDTSSLTNVLEINLSRRVVVCEPNVPMDDLVVATLKHNLVPPVVPEFPGITVGGGFSGTAGESSSFKHGFFDRTVNWCEMILANGTVVTASPSENQDLFYGAAGAFGTLGLTTLFEIQLEEANKYVEVEYLPVASASEAVHALQRYSEDSDSCDYVDAIMLSASFGVLVVGRRMTREAAKKMRNPPPKRQRFRFPWNNWFYLHAGAAAAATRFHRKNSLDASDEASFRDPEGLAATAGNGAARRNVTSRTLANSVRELVPLKDYLFRYDRGAFWTGMYAFRMFWMPFNRITRFVLDPFFHTRTMYRALHHSGLARRFIIQDLALPAVGAVAFCEWIDRKYSIYPIWLCPLRGDSPAIMHSLPPQLESEHDENSYFPSPEAVEDEVLINVGVWGPPKNTHSSRPRSGTDPDNANVGTKSAARRGSSGYGSSKSEFARFVDDNRMLERKVRELGGVKWLYAQSFYTEDEFWSLYDRESYDELRRKYAAETLPDVFQKVKMPQQGLEGKEWRRPSRLRGILYGTLGRDHILAGKRPR